MQTILVVDDERKLRQMIRVYLEREGFRVIEASNGQEALYQTRLEKPDLVIPDLMMPEMNGYDYLRKRESDEVPVIVLTAKVEETDEVLGLELGADDYVTKPFGIQALMARVRAVLRRRRANENGHAVLRLDDVSLDADGRAVSVGGRRVDLTPSEFELLAALMSAPGRVFSRLDLAEHIGTGSVNGYERTINVHIRNLRTKIEADPSDPQHIETVYGMGYRFAHHGARKSHHA